MSRFKFVFLIVALSFLTGQINAIEMDAEFRVAGFFPTSQKFTKFYGNAIPCYSIEARTELYCSFDAWTNLDWLHSHKRHGCQSRSTIDIVNGSLGVAYKHSFCDDWKSYLGIGASFGGVFLKNKAPSFKDHSSKFAMGLVLKSGVTYTFCNGILIDGFLDYLYQPVKYHHTVDVGGVKLGLGLGYSF